MSTTEAVDAQGNTSNPTKSPCDRYVFNTVLTRAKALVVAVGSALALLRIESHMVKQYKGAGSCWSLYLKSCLEKNTFIIPPTVTENEKKKELFIAKLSALLGVTDTLQTPPSSKESSPKMLSGAVKESSVQALKNNNPAKIANTNPNTVSKAHSHQAQVESKVGTNTVQQKTSSKGAKNSAMTKSKSVSVQQRGQANQGKPLPSY